MKCVKEWVGTILNSLLFDMDSRHLAHKNMNDHKFKIYSFDISRGLFWPSEGRD